MATRPGAPDLRRHGPDHCNQVHWRRFPTGEPFEGGSVRTLTLTMDEIAAFIPAGRIIPLGPAVEHTGALGGAWPVDKR